MEKWTIDATDRSPLVLLDRENSVLKLEGRSYPEEGMDFFDPIILRFKTLQKSETPISLIHVRLEYYNSATSKALAELFQGLVAVKRAGFDATVIWEYEEEDDGIQDDIDMFIDTFDLKFDIRFTEFN
jgi:hypothetical protein